MFANPPLSPILFQVKDASGAEIYFSRGFGTLPVSARQIPPLTVTIADKKLPHRNRDRLKLRILLTP